MRELDKWERLARAAGADKAGEVAPDEAFLDAACDDLSLAAAIARVHALFDEAGQPRRSPRCAFSASTRFASRRSAPTSPARIARRLDLLKARDFAAADALRDELATEGVLLKDGKDPATGERVTTWEIRR